MSLCSSSRVWTDSFDSDPDFTFVTTSFRHLLLVTFTEIYLDVSLSPLPLPRFAPGFQYRHFEQHVSHTLGL